MVFFFESTATTPPTLIYMGKDKYENEDLLKHVSDEDIWFHVDRLSSAHVYLQLPIEFPDWQKLPEDLLIDCAQLVKANSIEGNKKNIITVIYTPSTNLLKTKGMETGSVSFKKDKMVKKINIQQRENIIVNRLNKTKVEKPIEEFIKDKIDRRREKSSQQRAEERSLREQTLQEQKLRREQEELKAYKTGFSSAHMNTNADIASKYLQEDTGEVDVDAFEDDFM